jgi:hypothetical protein
MSSRETTVRIYIRKALTWVPGGKKKAKHTVQRKQFSWGGQLVGEKSLPVGIFCISG